MARWESELTRISGKSNFAHAIRYALSRKTEFRRFLEAGRVELDKNSVKRVIRPICITRKNALFAEGRRRTLGEAGNLCVFEKHSGLAVQQPMTSKRVQGYASLLSVRDDVRPSDTTEAFHETRYGRSAPYRPPRRFGKPIRLSHRIVPFIEFT